MDDMRGALGVRDSSEAFNAEMLRQKQMDSLAMQVSTVTRLLDGIAKQFPASSQMVDSLKQAMSQLQTRIVGSAMSEPQRSTGSLG
jgi:hypothetical protein